MAIFNEYGNLDDEPGEVVQSSVDELWKHMESLLDSLTIAEARALEQAVTLAISNRFGEHRLRQQVAMSRKARKDREDKQRTGKIDGP